MANGIPVRLSEALTSRARTAATVLERSLTEQVEHWARLGQAVEAAISAATSYHLKARSHDAELSSRLTFAGTPEGRARAAAVIRERKGVRHGIDADGTVVRVAPTGKRTRARTPR